MLLWDLSGEKKFEAIRALYFQGVYGVLLVFDLTRKESFEELDKWIHDIEQSTQTKGVPILLLGNKSDLILSEQDSKISQEEIDEYVVKLNKRYEGSFKLRYLPTSALSGLNVNEGFVGLVEEIMNWLPKRLRI